MPEPSSARRFLVITAAGDVVVTVNEQAGGLDTDLIGLTMADAASASGITMTTPLSAFAAKMVDIIEGQGTAGFGGGERMRELLVREKATAELLRIERFAKEQGKS